jgi:molybdopterin-containing oxidoreductase family iron-sulfur binding subunit
MVIDLKKCIGCYGCAAVCKAENATPPGVLWCRVVKRESGVYPRVRRLSLPLQCMHCAEAECLKVCPTGATFRHANGIVDIERDKCVGCRYCMMACPYQARFFQAGVLSYFSDGPTPYEAQGYQRHQEGTVSKCNFCLPRLEQGLEPACVANCMTRARVFGDLDDPGSEVSRTIRDRGGAQLYPELGTDPSIFYLAP